MIVRLKTKISVTDARFEVIGAPYSLLSVSLSASQTLYTRRGTLVGVSGKAENVSMLEVKALGLEGWLADILGRPNQHYRSLNHFDEPLLEFLSYIKKSLRRVP